MKTNKLKIKRVVSYEIMIIPALIIFLLFIVYPASSTIYHGFTNWSDVKQLNYDFVGLKNYIRLFSDEAMMIGVKNSIIFAVVATILQSTIGLALALALDSKFKTKNMLRAIWYFPAVLSTLIIGYLWNYMLSTSDFGLINQLVIRFGFEKINFLGNPNIALGCIIFVSVWQWSGWTMTIYLANLQGISNELYESASVDGASRWQRFRYVTLPMLQPAVSFCVVTGMINGLKVFDIIYALTNGGPGGKTESIISIMMRKGFTEGFYGYSSAMGTVFLVIVLFISFFLTRLFNKWGDNIV